MNEVSVGLVEEHELEALVDLAIASNSYQASQKEGEVAQMEILAPQLKGVIPNLVAQDNILSFVAREPEKQALVGYLLLNTQHFHEGTGEQMTFIVDLYVTPEYWGGSAVKRILNKAAQHTHSLGMRRMIGEVSVHNHRAYIKALRLGFLLDRMKIGAPCGAEGIVAEAEESLVESTYSKSRKGKKQAAFGIPGSWKELRTWRVKHRGG